MSQNDLQERQIAKLLVQVSEANDQITKKANKDLVKKLGERIEDFTNLQHVNFLRDDLLPKVEGFSQKLEILLADNMHVKECVRRFD